MLGNSFQEATEGNANRLLKIEKQAQKKIKHLPTDIQKGSLFQTVVEIESQKNIIICKAEHEEILDEIDLQIHSGFPMKNQLYKAIMIVCNDAIEIQSVSVYDTNPKMAEYWWQDYLELSEIYNSAHNTTRSIDIILKKIIEPLRQEHPQDYQILRNSFLGYMRNKEEFNLSEYIDDNLTSYTPFDTKVKVKMQNITKKTLDLPKKYGFDSRFSIDKTKINKRRVKETIKLTDSIDLILNDHIENIRETIQSEEDDQGSKFLKIKTEQGYKWFSESQK